MLNKVMLIGNLGKDPEVNFTPKGQKVANFSIATTRKWKDGDGKRQEHTEWHFIQAWGRTAEIAEEYLKKGKQVYVEGRLQTRSWDDKESGKKVYRTEVICQNFQMLGGRKDADTGSSEEGQSNDGPGKYFDGDSNPYGDNNPF